MSDELLKKVVSVRSAVVQCVTGLSVLAGGPLHDQSGPGWMACSANGPATGAGKDTFAAGAPVFYVIGREPVVPAKGGQLVDEDCGVATRTGPQGRPVAERKTTAG